MVASHQDGGAPLRGSTSSDAARCCAVYPSIWGAVGQDGDDRERGGEVRLLHDEQPKAWPLATGATQRRLPKLLGRREVVASPPLAATKRTEASAAAVEEARLALTGMSAVSGSSAGGGEWATCSAIRRLRSKFERFRKPGAPGLSQERFAALLSYHGCCPPAAAAAFFHSFASSSFATSEPCGEGLLLSFKDFVAGACAADPQDAAPLCAKVQYYVRFFSVAPRSCFRFERSLLGSRWGALRGAFLVACRGTGQFSCFRALQGECPDVFRHILDFL